MKIEKKEKSFEPVTITLETQDELDLFYEVFRRVGGSIPLRIFGNTSATCNALNEQGANQRSWDVSGDIYID